MFKFRWKKIKDAKKREVEIPRLSQRSDDQTESVICLPPPRPSDHIEQRSFASPEGVPMDPLAPAALAVSSELMGHIGTGLTMLREHSKKVQKYVLKNNRLDLIRKPWKSVVNIVLVEAENLPDGPDAGSNSLYCKFKLGTETHKSKRVPKLKSIWRERFNLLQNDETNLEVTVWQKYKQKNFMGRCVIDLSLLEKERTHDVWRELECGYGRLHLVITLSDRAVAVADNVLTSSVRHALPVVDRYTWYRLDNDWSEVGQLCVTVHGARGLSGSGLSGRTDAYCVLELDNNRVQTHTARCTSQPHWGKSFKFAITDITSTLDIGVYNETLFSPIKGEMIGKISIPLLRINEHEKRWFALKNRSKKSSARGNCPRILLEISVVWNPIKASLRLMSPKETKYVQKPPKFDIPLIYSNLNFIKDIFHAIYLFNEHIKQVFEWNNRDKSTLALFAWVAFWYVFKFWMAPLLLLAPFIYNWIKYKNMNHHSTSIAVYQSDDEIDEEVETNKQDVKTIKNRLYDLQDLTLTIKNGIDYLVSTIERINNLTNFTVPYLSYLVMIILVAASVVLYVIPVNYLFMALGIYKYTRKYLNPERRPNNDILDFLSRVPNNEILKEWRELKVPEPNQNRLDNNL